MTNWTRGEGLFCIPSLSPGGLFSAEAVVKCCCGDTGETGKLKKCDTDRCKLDMAKSCHVDKVETVRFAAASR